MQATAIKPVNQRTAGACNDGLTTSKKIPTTVFVPYLQSFKSHQSHCSILNNLLVDVLETSLGVRCGRICCDRYEHWVMRAPKWDDSAVIMYVGHHDLGMIKMTCWGRRLTMILIAWQRSTSTDIHVCYQMWSLICNARTPLLRYLDSSDWHDLPSYTQNSLS